MDRTITARRFLAYDYAGLTLVGLTNEGYEWLSGEVNEFVNYMKYEEDTDFPENHPTYQQNTFKVF